MQTKTAEERYNQLVPFRRPFLERGQRNSSVTIPTLLPPEGTVGGTELAEPYQSVGSVGNSHLAAKTVLSLFPANTPFFRLSIDEAALAEISQNPEDKTMVDKELQKSEQAVMDDVASGTMRAKQTEAILHLQVVGNVLEYVIDSKSVRVYKLDSYCVRRDPRGTVLEIVTKEAVGLETFSDDEIAEFGLNSGPQDKPVVIYTWIKLKEKTYEAHQEINGIRVSGSEATYPMDELPYIALRFRAIDGEDYGRSLVDEVIGDLVALDVLSQALQEGSLAASKVVWAVEPGVTTRIEDLRKARNGDYVYAKAAEVNALQLNKFNDFRVAETMIQKLEQRLAATFMMNSSIQRAAERVTAEEIRTMAQELDDGRGGIYSLLAQELQLPLVRILLSKLTKENRIIQMPKHIVKPQIVTGIEALGRGHDAEKLRMFLAEIGPLPGAAERLNTSEIIERLATARGINTTNLIKSDAQMQQEQQRALMQQTMANIGQQTAPGLIQNAVAQQAQQAAPQQ